MQVIHSMEAASDQAWGIRTDWVTSVPLIGRDGYTNLCYLHLLPGQRLYRRRFTHSYVLLVVSGLVAMAADCQTQLSPGMGLQMCVHEYFSAESEKGAVLLVFESPESEVAAISTSTRIWGSRWLRGKGGTTPGDFGLATSGQSDRSFTEGILSLFRARRPRFLRFRFPDEKG